MSAPVTWNGLPVDSLNRSQLLTVMARIAEWLDVRDLAELERPRLSASSPEGSRRFWEQLHGK